MSVPEYVAGEWTAVVRPGFLALLGDRPAAGGPAVRVDERVVRALWQGVGAGVLDALAELTRGGLGALPPFALVAVSGNRAHVVLRGDVEVLLDTPGETLVLRAPEVSTWTERVVDEAVRIEVRAGAGELPAGPALPLADGVVRAAGLRVSLLPDDEAGDERAGEGADAPPAVPSLEPLGGTAPLPVVGPGTAGDGSSAGPTAPTQRDGAADDDRPVAVPEFHVPVTAAVWASQFAQTRAEDPSGVVAAAEALLTPRDSEENAPSGPRPPVEPAAPAQPVPSALSVPPVDDDHDGLTILSDDLAVIREQLPAWAADGAGAAERGATALRVSQAAPTRPARVVLSTGVVVDLDRPVLIGRAPQVARVSARELPRLVTVPSPQQDVSRTHAEVRLEGDHVLVTDLDSTNGVHVSRTGEAVRRLHPGEPSVVGTGEVVDLGDGVTFTVERGS